VRKPAHGSGRAASSSVKPPMTSIASLDGRRSSISAVGFRLEVSTETGQPQWQAAGGQHGGTALRRHHAVNEARAGAQLLLMDR
jgi:hypothetical protein